VIISPSRENCVGTSSTLRRAGLHIFFQTFYFLFEINESREGKNNFESIVILICLVVRQKFKTSKRQNCEYHLLHVSVGDAYSIATAYVLFLFCVAGYEN